MNAIDQFYGDRTGEVTEPFGHVWYIATYKGDVSSENEQSTLLPRAEVETLLSVDLMSRADPLTPD